MGDRPLRRHGGGFTSAITIGTAAILLGFASAAAVVPVAVICYGYGMACGSVAPSQVSSRYFGSRDFTRVYALVTMTTSISSIFGQPTPGFIYDITGSYALAWYIAAGMTALSMLLFSLAHHQNKKAWTALFEQEQQSNEIT